MSTPSRTHGSPLYLAGTGLRLVPEVADVTDAGVHDEAVAEIARDAADLVRRLDDDERGHGLLEVVVDGVERAIP